MRGGRLYPPEARQTATVARLRRDGRAAMGGERNQVIGDGTLVARVLAGDTEMYGVLIERYRDRLGRYATAMCGDADLAADAMQEAFIRAYDHLAACREPDRFGSWFFRILTNQCHNHRSHSRARQPLETVASATSADRDLTSAEIRYLIDRALGALPPELREAFVLREIEARPYPEMAELLHATEPALRKRVERARHAVRSALEEWL